MAKVEHALSRNVSECIKVITTNIKSDEIRCFKGRPHDLVLQDLVRGISTARKEAECVDDGIQAMLFSEQKQIGTWVIVVHVRCAKPG